MDKLISISVAAHALGVSVTTLRRWEREGRLQSDRTHAGHRRYNLSKILPESCHINDSSRRTVAYARVSSHEIITVFSARLYGSRSRKNQKLLDGVKRVVEEAAKC